MTEPTLVLQPDGSERPMNCYWRESIEGAPVRCHNPVFMNAYPDGHDYTSCRWCEPDQKEAGHD